MSGFWVTTSIICYIVSYYVIERQAEATLDLRELTYKIKLLDSDMREFGEMTNPLTL